MNRNPNLVNYADKTIVHLLLLVFLLLLLILLFETFFEVRVHVSLSHGENFHVFTHLLHCGFILSVHVDLRYAHVRQAMDQMELVL